MKQSQLVDYESDGLTCPKCGQSCGGRHGLSQHHNAAHGETFKPLAACDSCGDLYYETHGNLANSPNTYCSDSCRSEGLKGRTPPNKNREVRNCDYCEAEYEVTVNSDQRFCSHECFGKNRTKEGAFRGENNPLYKEDLTLECEQCGCEYDVPPVHKDSRFCSAECRHDWMRSRTGSDHPLHKGGYDYYVAIRNGLSDVGWGTLRKRHNDDACEACGAETSPHERDLSLHHIVPVLAGGTNGEYNFMTLCEPCHSRVETYCSDLPGFDRILAQ